MLGRRVSIPLAASAYPVECRSNVDMHRERQPSSLASPFNPGYAVGRPHFTGVAIEDFGGQMLKQEHAVHHAVAEQIGSTHTAVANASDQARQLCPSGRLSRIAAALARYALLARSPWKARYFAAFGPGKLSQEDL